MGTYRINKEDKEKTHLIVEIADSLLFSKSKIKKKKV